MKRDPSLVALSWEHHTGLVYARRIKKMVEANEPLQDIRDYILLEWNATLERHFNLEETVVMPPFVKHVPHSEELEKMVSDHNRFRVLVRLFTEGKGGHEEMLEFSANMLAHIRFEEDILFPIFEKNIPADDLKIIGDKLNSVLPHP